MTQSFVWLPAISDLIKVISENKKWHMSALIRKAVSEARLLQKLSTSHILRRPVKLCKFPSTTSVLNRKMKITVGGTL